MVTPLSLVVKANGLMQASSYTYEAVDQAGSLLLSRARLVPQFQMANLTPAARQQAAFKRQLNSATRRRQFEDFSGWDLHDKSLGLPRWIQPREPNKILSHADALTVYSVEEEQYEPLSISVNETSPLAIQGLGISTYREVFGPREV